jgi:oleandomycin transport system ATP-binding protein
LRALGEAGIEVSELGLRGASLDDVFLALTGQSGRLRPGEEEDAA